MKNALLILFIALTCTMCGNKNSPEKAFEGRFKGSRNNISATANLRVEGGRLSGTITMNGQPAEVDGDVEGDETWGRLTDKSTGKKYKYDGYIEDDELVISIQFPELNDEKIKLVMKKETGSTVKKGQKNSKREIDPDVVGTWKNTEILGGGYGSESMTNESFMEFREDGTCISWAGQSSGPGYYREEDRSNAQQGEWYTDGNQLFFIDPSSGEEASTNYSVNESGLLMSNGGNNKKIWQRVR